jgi:autotransporter-associated beta strand protein
MDADRGGFHAADTWRNDITGTGGLVKTGTGTLTLAGANRYTGGTRLEHGGLVAAGTQALGGGDVDVRGGTLTVAAGTRVAGSYRQAPGSTLAVTLRRGAPSLTVARTATVERGSTLQIRLDPLCPPAAGEVLPVLTVGCLRGTFDTITVDGCEAVPRYTAAGLFVRLRCR